MLTKTDLKLIGELMDDKLGSQLEPIKKDIMQIRKGQKIIVNFFDHEYLELRKGIELIEAHLNLHSKN